MIRRLARRHGARIDLRQDALAFQSRGRDINAAHRPALSPREGEPERGTAGHGARRATNHHGHSPPPRASPASRKKEKKAASRTPPTHRPKSPLPRAGEGWEGANRRGARRVQKCARRRQDRIQCGHSRLACDVTADEAKTWMPGTSPGMTAERRGHARIAAAVRQERFGRGRSEPLPENADAFSTLPQREGWDRVSSWKARASRAAGCPSPARRSSRTPRRRQQAPLEPSA